jgi:hypothetical protein
VTLEFIFVESESYSDAGYLGTCFKKIMSYRVPGCFMVNLRTRLRLFQYPEWLDAIPRRHPRVSAIESSKTGLTSGTRNLLGWEVEHSLGEEHPEVPRVASVSNPRMSADCAPLR